MASTIRSVIPKVVASFAEGAKQTAAMMSRLGKTLGEVKEGDLPKTLAELDRTTQNPQQVGNQTENVGWFVRVLLRFSVAPGVSFVVNGVMLISFARNFGAYFGDDAKPHFDNMAGRKGSHVQGHERC